MKINNCLEPLPELLNNNNLENSVDEVLEKVCEMDSVYTDFIKRSKLRSKNSHSINDKNKIIAITDFIVEYRFYKQNKLDSNNLNILWIENAPDENIKKDIGTIVKHFPTYRIYLLQKDNYDCIIDEFNKGELQVVLYSDVDQQKKQTLNVVDIDIIILDLYLSSQDKAKIQGEDILRFLRKKYVGIPVIVLSKSEDYDEVARLYSMGVDFFVNKKFALQIPLFIHRVFDKYGIILWLIFNDKDKVIYRKNLIKNIRYWMFHPNFLWYGDKCYHMIDHAFHHIYDNWINTNKILKNIKEIKENKEREANSNINEFDWKDDDLYSFCMAMWLHDIGHKGNERYGEAYEIRDTHGIISGELILQRPDMFDIIERDEVNPNNKEINKKKYDEYYKGFTFPLGNQSLSVIQIIRDRKDRNNLSNAEKIALLSIFHKSNAPITPEDGLKMQAKNRSIPSEYFENSDSRKGKLITLLDIIDRRDSSYAKRFLEMISLFRLIDGIDLHKTRVGDESEKELKLKVISQDKNYYLGKLKETAEFLIEKVAKNDSSLAIQIYNELYNNAKDKIEKQEFNLDSSSEYQKFIEEKLGKLENYWMILRYAAFISVQDGHFDLHNCVDDIDIINLKSPNDKDIIGVVYYLNKNISWLINKTVREMRVKKMTIFEKLFGQVEIGKILKLPYPIDELQEGVKYLNNLLNLSYGFIVRLNIPNDVSQEELKKQLDKFKYFEDGFQLPGRNQNNNINLDRLFQYDQKEFKIIKENLNYEMST